MMHFEELCEMCSNMLGGFVLEEYDDGDDEDVMVSDVVGYLQEILREVLREVNCELIVYSNNGYQTGEYELINPPRFFPRYDYIQDTRIPQLTEISIVGPSCF